MPISNPHCPIVLSTLGFVSLLLYYDLLLLFISMVPVGCRHSLCHTRPLQIRHSRVYKRLWLFHYPTLTPTPNLLCTSHPDSCIGLRPDDCVRNWAPRSSSLCPLGPWAHEPLGPSAHPGPMRRWAYGPHWRLYHRWEHPNTKKTNPEFHRKSFETNLESS